MPARKSCNLNMIRSRIPTVIREACRQVSEALEPDGLWQEEKSPGYKERRKLLQLDGLCEYCRKAPADTIDHFMPLVINGRPTPFCNDIWNAIPACKDCNSSKGNRTQSAWLLSGCKKNPVRDCPDTRKVVLEKFARYEEAFRKYCLVKHVDDEWYSEINQRIRTFMDKLQTDVNAHREVVAKSVVRGITVSTMMPRVKVSKQWRRSRRWRQGHDDRDNIATSVPDDKLNCPLKDEDKAAILARPGPITRLKARLCLQAVEKVVPKPLRQEPEEPTTTTTVIVEEKGVDGKLLNPVPTPAPDGRRSSDHHPDHPVDHRKGTSLAHTKPKTQPGSKEAQDRVSRQSRPPSPCPSHRNKRVLQHERYRVDVQHQHQQQQQQRLLLQRQQPHQQQHLRRSARILSFGQPRRPVRYSPPQTPVRRARAATTTARRLGGDK
jgi:HNH endonuclease